MKTIRITIDYSNICQDYNTAFLDRDNNDPATRKCMKSILTWMDTFLTNLLTTFNYEIFQLNSDIKITINDLSSKRFLFYSLEKEITLQSFTINSSYHEYNNNAMWLKNYEDGLLIKNDDEGEGIHLYFNKDSKLHIWLLEYLDGFTLDEAPQITAN